MLISQLKMCPAEFTACTYIVIWGVEIYSSNQAPMITFNTYMTQFTCLHHGILIREKITTYFNAKKTSKKIYSLREIIIQGKTPDFTHERMYERVFFLYSTQDWWFSRRLLHSTNWKISLPPQLLKNNWKDHVAGVKHK